MEFSEDLKSIIKQYGFESITKQTLPNILSDVSKEYSDNLALKRVFTSFIKEGYGQKIINIKDESPNVRKVKLAQIKGAFANKTGYDIKIIESIFFSIEYAFGWKRKSSTTKSGHDSESDKSENATKPNNRTTQKSKQSSILSDKVKFRFDQISDLQSNPTNNSVVNTQNQTLPAPQPAPASQLAPIQDDYDVEEKKKNNSWIILLLLIILGVSFFFWYRSSKDQEKIQEEAALEMQSDVSAIPQPEIDRLAKDKIALWDIPQELASSDMILCGYINEVTPITMALNFDNKDRISGVYYKSKSAFKDGIKILGHREDKELAIYEDNIINGKTVTFKLKLKGTEGYDNDTSTKYIYEGNGFDPFGATQEFDLRFIHLVKEKFSHDNQDEIVVGDNINLNKISGFIDLGLPSGTLWAEWNIGATKSSDYGAYISWGALSPSTSYTSETCETYQNSLKNLDKTKDAATINWNENWQIPSYSQMVELVNECKWNWTTIDGVYGASVSGPNGKEIFLPAAGGAYKEGIIDLNKCGNYWSKDSENTEGEKAIFLFFNDQEVKVTEIYRTRGFSIRPVRNSKIQNMSSDNTTSVNEDDPIVYTTSNVQVQPQFPGGENAMYNWLAHHINYPVDAAEEDVSGKVVVEFVISTTGAVKNVRVVKGVHKSLDEEALRVVKSMPKWEPARYNGKPVNVTYVLPISFNLTR